MGSRILDIFADSKALLSDEEPFLHTEGKRNILQVPNQSHLADDPFLTLCLYLFLVRDQMDLFHSEKAYINKFVI